MKETLKNIFYDLVLIALILFILWFFLFPIIEDGLEYQNNMNDKIQEINDDIYNSP